MDEQEVGWYVIVPFSADGKDSAENCMDEIRQLGYIPVLVSDPDAESAVARCFGLDSAS